MGTGLGPIWSWMVAEGGEGENPLPFSLQPQNVGGGGGG